MQDALDERATAIQQRAEIVLDRAIAAGEPWLAGLTEPVFGQEQTARRAATVIAAYRDKYGLGGEPSPLGASEGLTTTRKADYELARAALNRLTANVEPTDSTRTYVDIYNRTAAAEPTAAAPRHELSCSGLVSRFVVMFARQITIVIGRRPRGGGRLARR